MPPHRSHLAIVQLAAAFAGALAACASQRLPAAEPTATHNFNGPETVWQIVDDRRVGRVVRHECLPGGARDNAGAEHISIAAPGGESIQLHCPTASVAVIDELQIGIWVKANRPDIQLGVRVALPRGGDAKSEPPTRLVVRGAIYDRPGRWQQLILSDVPKLLAAEVRLARATQRTSIDARGAVVDAVVLIVPGDPHGVEVETDELVVDGIPSQALATATPTAEVEQAQYSTATAAPPSTAPPTPAVQLRPLTGAGPRPSTSGKLRVHADMLLVDDRPFVPRVLQWQGEPFAFLAERGFNVAWLQQPPTAEQSADAERHGLWFICEPPPPESLPNVALGRPADRVLAWHLDDDALERDPAYGRRWANLVRERDVVPGRPVIIAPQDAWNAASHAADVLWARRARLGFTPVADYAQWLEARAAGIRPGTPLWTCFPTQFGAAVGRQLTAFSGTPTPAPSVDADHVESLVEVAAMRGIRGFVFQSDAPLNAPDVASRLRASGAERINRRLVRLEPWLAAGNVVNRFPSVDPAWSGLVLQVDAARLLVPVASRDASTAAPASSANVTFVVPGVPESCHVYALSPVALEPLPVQRIAGGMRIALKPQNSFALLTEDPKVVQRIRQIIAQDGPRAVRAERESAALRAATLAAAAQRLSQLRLDATAAAQAANAATAQLQQVDAALAAGNIQQAYQLAIAVNQTLDAAAASLRLAVAGQSPHTNNPLSFAVERLPEYATYLRNRARYATGENLLYGGDFEDLGQLTQIGWRHFSSPVTGITSQAELSTAEPRHGAYCLTMNVASTAARPPATEGAAVWIESPPVALAAGQIVEITGWARVDADSAAGDEGLQIFDSLGGPELALAIRRTNGWERFTMTRAVPEPVEMRLTFALAGLGSAKIDAVMVRPLQQPPTNAPPGEPTTSTGDPAPTVPNKSPYGVPTTSYGVPASAGTSPPTPAPPILRPAPAAATRPFVAPPARQ